MGLSSRAILVTVALAAGLGAQAPQPLPAVPPIPAVEQFVQGTGLRVRLTMRATDLAAFEDPGFVVVFENVGSAPLRLNPHVAPGLRIYDEGGAQVPPSSWIVYQRAYVEIRRDTVKEIPVGGTWQMPVLERGYAAGDQTASYGFDNGLLLPEGRYTARFTYLSYPDYSTHYDMFEVTDVWEGRVESEPVSFSLATGAEAIFEEIETTRRTRLPSRERRWALAASVPELEAQLASTDDGLVRAALDRLVELDSRSSLPVIQQLIDSGRSWQPYWAGSAIAKLGGVDTPALMRRLASHDDTSVLRVVIEHLVHTCEPGDAPVFERGLVSGSEWDSILGIVACGGAASFPALRSLSSASAASTWLHALTFTPMTFDDRGWSQALTLAEWDAWIVARRDETREDWALRALERPEHQWSYHAQAVDYLRKVSDRERLPLFRRMASSLRYETRIAAARGVAAFERAEGIALLRRELLNRHPDAVRKAIDALNAVTGQSLQFDVTVPSERQRALEAYVP